MHENVFPVGAMSQAPLGRGLQRSPRPDSLAGLINDPERPKSGVESLYGKVCLCHTEQRTRCYRTSNLSKAHVMRDSRGSVKWAISVQRAVK